MANDKKTDAETKQEAEQSLDTKIANAVGKAVSEAMPMATMGAAKVMADILNPKKALEDAAAKELFSASDRCSKCHQMKRACKDKHVLLIVAPANPRRFERFPGITVGAVTYISPRMGKPIYVPAENDILYRLQQWENEEDNLREGHSLIHDSGVLSPVPNNSKIIPANPLGFREMGQ